MNGTAERACYSSCASVPLLCRRRVGLAVGVERVEVEMGGAAAADLDHAVGTALGEVRREIHAQLGQGREVLALLGVLKPLDVEPRLGLLAILLQGEVAAGLLLTEFGLFAFLGQPEIVLHLGRLLSARLLARASWLSSL